jgi:hypothetical protein
VRRISASFRGPKTLEWRSAIRSAGVRYYLTSLSLAPHETRAIDLRSLRDAQVADFKKHKIPASAADVSPIRIVWETRPSNNPARSFRNENRPTGTEILGL